MVPSSDAEVNHVYSDPQQTIDTPYTHPVQYFHGHRASWAESVPGPGTLYSFLRQETKYK